MPLTRGRSVRFGGYLHRDSIGAAPSGAAPNFSPQEITRQPFESGTFASIAAPIHPTPTDDVGAPGGGGSQAWWTGSSSRARWGATVSPSTSSRLDGSTGS